jgi:hypothetical protein
MDWDEALRGREVGLGLKLCRRESDMCRGGGWNGGARRIGGGGVGEDGNEEGRYLAGASGCENLGFCRC